MNNSKTYIAIIPARFASTRFPGKPLVDIKGKPMIQHVYENAKKVFDYVVVATDDARIKQKVEDFNGVAVITSEKHKSGTDRCAEALEYANKKYNKQFDVVINIQGDEPFISTEQLELISSCFNNNDTQIATLIKKIETTNDLFDINKPKVVVDKNNNAIYFSRNPIPYLRDIEKDNWINTHTYFKHIGMYAYKSSVLLEITKLPQGNLEKAESLEQLRWIENGYAINTAITDIENISVDTPQDLLKIK